MCDDLNSILSTRDNINNLVDEIEILSKQLILQTIKSGSGVSAPSQNNELLQLTKLIIQKQNQLNGHLSIASEQQILYNKINKLKEALVESDSDIKSLLLYLKEAEQVLSSAVYQSRMKLNMIKKAKPLPSELIIRYAKKISADYGVCCPENWTPDNPRRPYPTDADMRQGWLAKINSMSSDLALAPGSDAAVNEQGKSQLMRSNSRMIDPIVPQEFGFGSKYSNAMSASNSNSNNNQTEYMSDAASDSSSDSDSNMT